MNGIGNTMEIPKTCDVLVIGGGPAGSTVAAELATDGIDVVLLEKASHPRPQVGESLIPHFWKYTDRIGASELVEREGFIAKAGGITVWNGQIHRIAFAEFGFTRPALHVERDVFDALLLSHAAASGARVHQQVTVKRVDFGDPIQPRAHYLDLRGDSAVAGDIACRYVIDASGSGSVLAGQFKSKRLVQSPMRFLSLWGYFRNSRYVGSDGKSHPAADVSRTKPVTFVTSFEEGWIWHIAMRRLTSVGLVINTDRTRGMDRAQRERYFLETCRHTRYIDRLLEGAEYQENAFFERPDYSYYSSRLCGESFYLIGDAGSFVDPIYSHGVLNAFYGAATAAVAVKESLRDPWRRVRYAQMCENRMRQFYGFSRSLALGEFGGDGVDPDLVKQFMRSVSPVELELMLAASFMSERSRNFHRLAKDADLPLNIAKTSPKAHRLERLEV
jgi:flavin-dependent dehydrogenase